MGSTCMVNHIFVYTPSNLRNTSILSKNDIDAFHTGWTVRFAYAVGNAYPCIFFSVLNFNAKGNDYDIGEFLNFRF